MNVVATMMAMANGRLELIADFASISSAVEPPTRTCTPAGRAAVAHRAHQVLRRARGRHQAGAQADPFGAGDAQGAGLPPGAVVG